MILDTLDPDTVIRIHDDIVDAYSESDATTAGVRDRSGIETAIYLGKMHSDSTDAESVAVFMVELVSNHPFVDANKRTALNTTAALFATTGHDLRATRELAVLLKAIGVDRGVIDTEGVGEHLAARLQPREQGVAEDVRAGAAWHREAYPAVYDWLETN